MLEFRRSLCQLALLGTFAVAAGIILPNQAKAQAPTYVGTFAMTNIGTNKCATGPGGSQSLVVRAPWAAVPSQEWAFLLLPNKYYAIFNIKTGQFLGGSMFVTATAWTADPTQQWFLYPFGNNVYAFVNVGTGNMLTDAATGDGTANGLPLANQAWTANLNQLWYLYFLYK